MKSALNFLFKNLGVGITRYKNIEKIRKHAATLNILELFEYLDDPIAKNLWLSGKSKSQICQDLFVLSNLSFKRKGYFVEFGATNGFDLSNTYLMEKDFEWSGILAEPAACWHEELKKNRSCNIEFDCVWTHSGSTLNFNQVNQSELSTISEFSDADLHEKSRRNGISYKVNTISLIDLLIKYNAPQKIDYLSIDTEGSEYDILKDFDFSKYSFNIITCEHNYTSMRDKIYKKLTNNGYKRVFTEVSLFDDWYLNKSIIY